MKREKRKIVARLIAWGLVLCALAALIVFVYVPIYTRNDEAELAQKSGIRAATLGTRILRCETAPVAALAVLMNITNNM